MSTEEKIKMLIDHLTEHKYVTELFVYRSDLDSLVWDIYYKINGNINNKYFSITIMKEEDSDLRTKIADITECVDYIRHVLSKFRLL